ncbi:MAG: hypothetical protein [Bacteriophage sp.]|nr:MAG: hypothetical protein [Bacteriophage sp.]
MANNQKWHSLSDDSWHSIDFAISENTDGKNKAMAVFQMYSTEHGDNEMIGNIYIDEHKLDRFIKDLKKAQRQLIKENKGGKYYE